MGSEINQFEESILGHNGDGLLGPRAMSKLRIVLQYQPTLKHVPDKAEIVSGIGQRVVGHDGDGFTNPRALGRLELLTDDTNREILTRFLGGSHH